MKKILIVMMCLVLTACSQSIQFTDWNESIILGSEFAGKSANANYTDTEIDIEKLQWVLQSSKLEQKTYVSETAMKYSEYDVFPILVTQSGKIIYSGFYCDLLTVGDIKKTTAIEELIIKEYPDPVEYEKGKLAKWDDHTLVITEDALVFLIGEKNQFAKLLNKFGLF
jgi:hypothetical protein